jgi:hypothetical protein
VLYYLLVLREHQEPSVQPVKDLPELVTMLTELVKQPDSLSHLYVFGGPRLYLTEGPAHYLCVPGQRPIPLFEFPVLGQPILDGKLKPAPAAEPDAEYQAATASATPAPVLPPSQTI